ncbi:kinase-like protein [Aulographum hederae CBS 113979]|uniref:Kinase-like protein n=1 Tax=Aulographum hederae CBS 113979 TaxID=1176131 RepID=A0A6G1H2K6_9PEZI|nr:kinase-like protein [Aulographum hederae CBS 113979]
MSESQVEQQPANYVHRFSDGTPIPPDGKYHVGPGNLMSSARIMLSNTLPPGIKSLFAGGNTASLGLLLDGSVLKFLRNDDDEYLYNLAKRGLEVEAAILSTLGNHDRLIKYIGKHSHSLQIEFEENGDIKKYLLNHESSSISTQQRTKWRKQAAECVAFIHSQGVVHCDLHPNNSLLDKNLDLLICDFSGALFGELDGKAMESTRFWLPRDPLSDPNQRTDIFALGSVMYFIMTGRQPYEDLSDDEVTARFRKVEFPDVEEIVCGRTINGCWIGRLKSAQAVADEVGQEIHTWM